MITFKEMEHQLAYVPDSVFSKAIDKRNRLYIEYLNSYKKIKDSSRVNLVLLYAVINNYKPLL